MAQTAVLVHHGLQCFTGCRLHGIFQLSQTVFHLNDRLLCIQHLLIDGPMAQKILVLCQVAQRLPASQHHLSGIRLQFTYDYF